MIVEKCTECGNEDKYLDECPACGGCEVCCSCDDKEDVE